MKLVRNAVVHEPVNANKEFLTACENPAAPGARAALKLGQYLREGMRETYYIHPQKD